MRVWENHVTLKVSNICINALEMRPDWVSVTTTCSRRIEAIASHQLHRNTAQHSTAQLVTIIWSCAVFIFLCECTQHAVYIVHILQFDYRTIKRRDGFNLMRQFLSAQVNRLVNGAWHFGPDKVLAPFKYIP